MCYTKSHLAMSFSPKTPGHFQSKDACRGLSVQSHPGTFNPKTPAGVFQSKDPAWHFQSKHSCQGFQQQSSILSRSAYYSRDQPSSEGKEFVADEPMMNLHKLLYAMSSLWYINNLFVTIKKYLQNKPQCRYGKLGIKFQVKPVYVQVEPNIWSQSGFGLVLV